MSHSNIRPTGINGIFKPSMETEYTDQELNLIEERNFENLIYNFYDELIQVTIDGNPLGLNTRQRTNLVRAGIIVLKRRLGRGPRYKLTPKARYLILKMDEKDGLEDTV